jgi:hypothetical protein
VNEALSTVNLPKPPRPITSPGSLTKEKNVERTAQTDCVATTDRPGTDPVITTCRSRETGRVLTGKSAVSAPLDTVTDAGTSTVGSLLDKVTTTPSRGAGRVRITVPLPLAPPIIPGRVSVSANNVLACVVGLTGTGVGASGSAAVSNIGVRLLHAQSNEMREAAVQTRTAMFTRPI